MANEELAKTLAEALLVAVGDSNPDSLEIGTPGKGGAIKVYGNFSRQDEFDAKIRSAVERRKLAAQLLED